MEFIQIAVAHEGDEFWFQKEVDEDMKQSDTSAENDQDAFEIGAEYIEDLAYDQGKFVVGDEFEVEKIEVNLDNEETEVGWIVQAYIKALDPDNEDD